MLRFLSTTVIQSWKQQTASVGFCTQGANKPVAIVTGSSSGFGQDIAGELTRQGYALTLCGRNESGLETTRELCMDNGASAQDLLIIRGDLASATEPDKIASLTFEKFGKINALINSAAITPALDPLFEALTADHFDHMTRVNLRAPLLLTKSCVPYLKESKGTVINISSTIVTVPQFPIPFQGTIKAALEYFTQSAACAYGSMGIRVCGIRPSYVPTGVDSVLFKGFTEEQKGKFQKAVVDSQAIKRLGRKQDISEMVAFLLSDKASFITGVNINVDGGCQFQIPPQQ